MPTKRSISQLRYDRKATKCFSLKFNYKTDADILKHLSAIQNVQGYIKSLIRADIVSSPDAPAPDAPSNP